VLAPAALQGAYLRGIWVDGDLPDAGRLPFSQPLLKFDSYFLESVSALIPYVPPCSGAAQPRRS
jgi:hypothetical protein